MDARHYKHDELAALRGDKTQEEVAKIIGVKRLTIIRAESGVVASYELLCNLAKLYNVPVTSLLYPYPQQAEKAA